MKINVIKTYVLQFLLLAALSFTLLVLNKMTYVKFAIMLVAFAILIKLSLTKKKDISVYKKQVKWLMVVFALIYLGVFYLLGMAKYGFSKAAVIFSFDSIVKNIIPLALIIISSEIIRFVFLSQEMKIRLFKREFDLSKTITFISMVLIDLIIYIGVYDITRYNDFLTVTGFILFASVSCNLFYNYAVSRYGISGIVLYRLITVLYMYFIPVIPNVYVYFRAFLRMLYPYVLYLVLERMFSNDDFTVSYVERRNNVVGITVLVVIMALLTMLISCQFKYGILVIGSGSMTGSINKGDAVVFESYDNQKIKKGDVIVFERNGINLVHRVVQIKSYGEEIRYFTKGDANQNMDSGYITKDDIVGITKFRIMYIGHPTLWVRELFS